MEWGIFNAREDVSTDLAVNLVTFIDGVKKAIWMPRRYVSKRNGYYAAPLWLLAEKGIKPIADMEPLEVAENTDNQTVYIGNHKPFQHQLEAARKMGGLQHGALFMEMGTGKTKVALDLARSRYHDGKINALLYLCPVSVKGHIYQQMAIHGFYIPHLVVGIESLSSSITAYVIAQTFIQKCEGKVMIVIDEAHLLKNPDAKRSYRVAELSKECAYSLAMTGTPITQSPADLWGIFKALNPNKPLMGYSSYLKFEAKHLVLGGHNRKQVVGYRNLEPLLAHIAPMVYQVRKSECLDLPPKLYQKRTVSISPEVKEEYARLKKHWLDVYERTQHPNAIMAMFTELQKVITLGNANKVAMVQELATEANTRVVVWCKYRKEIADVSNAMLDCYVLDGSTPQKYREGIVQQWAASERGVLLANIGVGGLGIDLTAGNFAIYYSNTFRYSDRIQSEDRFHRIGQVNPVNYIDLWTDTGIDSIIEGCLRRKQNLADYIREQISNGLNIEV